MIKFVNAKINIGLNVVEKRKDGYHNLETVFLPVGVNSGLSDHMNSLCDVLEIVDTNSDFDEYVFMGNKIDCPTEKNLVVKAVNLFREEAKKRGFEFGNKKVVLEKLLPDGAGMGGGSADASFTLMMLNELTGEHFDDCSLAQMALQLGADCPFFIYNRPMLAKGVGEILTPIELNLPKMYALIVKPSVSISTREAFGNIEPHRAEIPIESVVSMPVEEWRHYLKNDFERSMFALHPEIEGVKRALYAGGAVYASMTGSGSAFYGLFKSEEVAREACNSMTEPFKRVVEL